VTILIDCLNWRNDRWGLWLFTCFIIFVLDELRLVLNLILIVVGIVCTNNCWVVKAIVYNGLSLLKFIIDFRSSNGTNNFSLWWIDNTWSCLKNFVGFILSSLHDRSSLFLKGSFIFLINVRCYFFGYFKSLFSRNMNGFFCVLDATLDRFFV